MRLAWRMYNNPIYDSSSPLYRELNKFQISQAEFSTLADGGFADAYLTLEDVTNDVLDEAFDTWLAKRIVVTDGAGNIAWEGLVTELSITNGYQIRGQTLDAFCNRVFVDYTYGGGTCPKGATCAGRQQRNETDVDPTSTTQTTIGIKEERLDITSSGILNATIASKVGDRFLAERMRQRTFQYTLGAGAEPQPNSISIGMLGYYSTLAWRQQSIKFTANTAIETIVQTALTTGSKAPFLDTSNGIFNSVGSSIQYNTNAAPKWLQDYILDVIEGGNSAGKRIFFQVIENRVPYLFVRGTAPKYFAASGDWRVFNLDRGSVPAYMVRAGGYIVAEDNRAELDEQSDVVNRRRASLVEETRYDCLSDILTIPPPSQEITIERLLTQARKRRRGK